MNKEFNTKVQAFKKGASARKAKTIDLIVDVLEKYKEQGNRDYSLATIGKIIHANGGPSTQAIRNKQGQDYRIVIDLFKKKEASTPSQFKSDLNPDNLHETILSKITEPTVRALVGILIREKKEAEQELKVLKQTPINIDLREQRKNLHLSQSIATLTASEKEALQHAISPLLMEQQGWEFLENGRVKDNCGVTVYKAGYINAVNKVLNQP